MKNNIRIILILLISAFFPLLMEKFVYSNEPFSIIRFIVFFLIFLFLFIIFTFNRKKHLEFIWCKRYIIGLLVFLILVIFGFNGSSTSIYNQVIQPNNPVEKANPIIGQVRVIRGDEWAVSTPTLLSQTKNNFDKESEILNAKKSNITLYPKIISKTLGTIATPSQLGFLVLPINQAFSFSWYFGYFLLFFCSLELLMLITNKNRCYSFLGAVIITFSPAIQWWGSSEMIAYGELAILLFDKYLKQNKFFNRVLISILIGWVGCCYIMCLYPAWQIPYGYLFLILAIWVGKNNKENFSIPKLLFLITIVLIVIGIVVVPIFINSYDIYLLIANTSYPGKRLSLGGDSWENLFNYFSSPFNSIRESSNASEMSQFISLYPIPIILGLYYWYHNKKKYKKDFLLVSLTLLAILLTIWNYVELPTFISKITLLYMSTASRSTLPASFVCILLLIYCIANYETIHINGTKYQNFIIAILVYFIGIIVIKSHYFDYISNKMILMDFIIYVPVIYLVLINKNKTNKYALFLLALFTFVTGITVHPLNIGLGSIYSKPLSKELEKIEKSDSNAKWATVFSPYYMSNYLVANGVATLNSTNYYPNFNLWNKLELKNEKEIYNRYAHILIDLTNENTSVKLNYSDQISLNLNSSDVCKLELNYLLSSGTELENYNNETVTFSNMYNEDGILIYSVKCNE